MTDTSGDLSADRIAAALAPIVADLQQKQKHSLRRALAWIEHAVLVVVMVVAFLSSGSSREASEASRRASEAAREACGFVADCAKRDQTSTSVSAPRTTCSGSGSAAVRTP